ncbi:MAG: hypothetical protein ACOC9Y_06440 [Chloroflexota bacterium]
MSDPAEMRRKIEEEMERTKFQRKAVAHGSAAEVMEEAVAFFKERGYKSGRTGRPNQVYVRGGRDGLLPVTHAELLVQQNVGKGKVTMVSVSGAGEKLSAVLDEYVNHLRAQARAARSARE